MSISVFFSNIPFSLDTKEEEEETSPFSTDKEDQEVEKQRKGDANSLLGEKSQNVKIMSLVRESNSTSRLCVPSAIALARKKNL